jgi:hypothetical protein
MRKQAAVLVDGAMLHWHAVPYRGDCGLRAGRAIDDEGRRRHAG